jgi:hypothetical protein
MYTISFTNKNTTPIVVQDDTINQQLDITLFGLSETPYGQLLQENFLHLLEHFALPSNPSDSSAPNTSEAIEGLLQNPISGELWYNKNNSTLYVFNGTNWFPLARADQVAANWGVIANGSQIPLPSTPLDGVPFQYSDCVWIVSPFNYPQNISFLNCSTDNNANVTVEYIYSNDSTNTTQYGYANYLILAIKGNQNYIRPPQPSTTPSPTVAASPTQIIPPTPPITPSITPSSGAPPTPTPAASPSSTPAASPAAPTPTPSSTATMTVTPTMTQSPYSSPRPTPTITPTPSSNFIQSVSVPSSVSGTCAVAGTSNASTCTAVAYGTATITGGIGPFTVSAIYVSGFVAAFAYSVSGNTISFNFSRTSTTTASSIPHNGYYELKVQDANGGIVSSSQILVQTYNLNNG